MNAITTYIDHMFRALPNTAEVRRARTELQQMSEDRFQELLAEGVSEHEAVGRVITQFGNLDEIADDLGIRGEVDGTIDQGDAPLEVSTEEAERFLQVNRRGSWLIGGGVFVILAGLTGLVLVQGGGVQLFTEGSLLRLNGEPIGMAILFTAIAIAVAMFIIAGMSMSRYEQFEGRQLRLEPGTLAHYQERREAERGRFTASIVSGVMLIILSVAATAIAGSLANSESGASGSSALLFIGVGVAVAILVIGSMRRGALDRLTAKGDYTPEKQEAATLVERVAGPYWVLALLVFLAWGFIGNAWDRSWIVWPIAGVLFGLVAVTMEAIKPGKRG
ncbi:hypothetical protein EG850_00110 [Gulosibacter macacae]|uniref:Uncharacterized protein n=1 Tax=Gulosibacter macacae TaxID=2488791 RepID=A0A3P3W7F1_9MICO|nr:permease prefix domain 1-containing protein [Gulosibacter macacae]RRJ88593.1 hypothetical protein EG850_00110 [Gulosibacter macacae]